MGEEDRRLEEAKKLDEEIKSSIMDFQKFADEAYPPLKAFTDDIVSGKVTDMKVIEKFVERLVEISFNDKIEALFWEIMNKLQPQHREFVRDFEELFEELHGGNDWDLEEDEDEDEDPDE